MARLVMVHGAFVGGWCWEHLTGPLEAAGHTVETLDLPAMGEDRTPTDEVTLDSCVERVREVLAARPQPVVLVANSMGGVISTQTASRFPEMVESIIYVAAFVPVDGESLLDLTALPEGAEDQVQANLVVEGDPPVGTMLDEASQDALYGCCTDEVAAAAIARQRPQPVAPFATPVSLEEGVFDSIPRSYVYCARDRAIPPPLQRLMLERAGCANVAELDTDHSPHMSRTAELAEAINGFVGAG